MKNVLLLWLAIFTACAISQKPATATHKKVPECIGQLIKKIKAAQKQNPPRAIYSYYYNDQIIYYVTAACCDQFSDVYDSSCNLIGHPDGGFTGKGDGRPVNFHSTKSEERLVWQDLR